MEDFSSREFMVEIIEHSAKRLFHESGSND